MSRPGCDPAGDAPAVAVVIPAYNAARTLAATLDSVVAQSFTQFEAIVVDDGSTDATLTIAQAYAARDRRLRIVSKPNSGVAEARNAGIAAARAPLIAPLDADDVWHPTFLEKLHAALRAAGDDTLFAFAGFRNLDAQGRVSGSSPHYHVGGRAFNRFLIKNFVGNGSGMMFRRAAALAVGGYERRLQHEFDAPGCEDWLLQLRLAAQGNVAVVPEYLVGYRKVPGRMSQDQVRMCRSRIHAFEILFGEVDCRHALAARWGLGRAQAECMIRELLAGNLVAAARLLPLAMSRDPVGTLAVFVEGAVLTAKKVARAGVRAVLPRRAQRLRRPFTEVQPLADVKPLAAGLLARRLARMAELDRSDAGARDAGQRLARPGPATGRASSRDAAGRAEQDFVA